MNKCHGCGTILQISDPNKEGYTKKIDNALCERCFRIKHYSDYKLVMKNNNDFIDILKNIGKTNSLVVLVVDLFNIPKMLDELDKYLNNRILLVLTKRDVLPLSIYDDNLLKYFDDCHLNIIDKVIISSTKNYHFDELISKIRKYQTSASVYVVGFTNAGKSTMINRLMADYTDYDSVITTSMLPSTTINTIDIKVDDTLTLIDTPGLLDDSSMMNIVDVSILKNIIPSKEIKPITYQIKDHQIIYIKDLLYVDCLNNNSLTFYVANTLDVERSFKEKNIDGLILHQVTTNDNEDIVINGLGFIKVVKKDTFKIYTLPNVDVYVRKALI